MGRHVSQAVMIQDFDQFRFFHRAQGLARLVVIDQDDAQARRVQSFPLPGDAKVMTLLVDNQELVVFFP